MSQLYREQILNLYRAESSGSPMLPRMLQTFSKQIYPLVERECCRWDTDGTRHFVTGGTPALVSSINTFRKFVEEFDHTGTVSMITFDGIIWACHNNGTFADKFIHSPYYGEEAEADIIKFLNDLSGTIRPIPAPSK